MRHNGNTVGEIRTQTNLLRLTCHSNHERSGRVLLVNCQMNTGLKSEPRQLTQGDSAAVRNAADGGSSFQRPSRERYFLAEETGFALLGDHMTMRVDLGISEDRRDAIFEAFRDEVLEPFGLLMHFIPGVLEYIMKKQFQETMMPHELPCPLLAGGCEACSSMFLILDESWALGRQFLKHAGHRWGPDAEPLGEGV